MLKRVLTDDRMANELLNLVDPPRRADARFVANALSRLETQLLQHEELHPDEFADTEERGGDPSVSDETRDFIQQGFPNE